MRKHYNVITRKVGTCASGTPLELREYVYGAVEHEFDENEMKDITVVPQDKWIAEDFVNILNEELESANWHSVVGLPDAIWNVLYKHRLTADQIDALMKDICQAMYEMI